jgi:hypothetical protein
MLPGRFRIIFLAPGFARHFAKTIMPEALGELSRTWSVFLCFCRNGCGYWPKSVFLIRFRFVVEDEIQLQE